MTMANGNGLATDRRSVIQSCAAIASLGVIGTGSALNEGPNNQVSTQSSNYYSFGSSDSASYIEGYLETGFLRYDAIGQEGIGNWMIPLKVNSNASSQETGTVNDWLQESYIEASWDSEANYDVYTDPTKNDFYTGASVSTYDPSDTDYQNVVEPLIEYGRGRLIDKAPYGTEIRTVGEVFYNMAYEFAGFGESGGSRESREVDFNWPTSIHDVSYWVKFEVSGPPGGSLLADVVDETNGHLHNAYNMKTDTPVYFNFPDLEPSNLSSMSSSELASRNVTKIDGAQLKRNPAKYGLDITTAQKLNDEPAYIYHADPSNDRRLREEMKRNMSN